MLNCAFKSIVQKKQAFRLFDLGHPLEKILRSWGAAHLHRVPFSTAQIQYAPLERMALLSGTLSGTLVMRSTMEFAVWLRDQRADASLGRYNETEVF